MEGYDVFLSYPNSEISECGGIAEAIASWGYIPFFDKAQVEAGDRWPRRVDSAIRTAAFGVIVLGSKGFGKRQLDEVEGLYNREFASSRREPPLLDTVCLIPYLLKDADPDELPFYLSSRPRAETLDQLRRLLAGKKAEAIAKPITQHGVSEEATQIARRPRRPLDHRVPIDSERRQELANEERGRLSACATAVELEELLIGEDSARLLGAEYQQEICDSISSLPRIYTALAERIACYDPPHPWTEHLILRAFTDCYEIPAVKSELEHAFDSWLGFVHPDGSVIRGSQEEEHGEERQKRFWERLGRAPEVGEIELFGYRLTALEDARLLRLGKLALAVISCDPRPAWIKTIVKGCVAEAVMDYPDKYHQFAWIFRLMPESIWSELEALTKELIGSGHIASKQAAFRLLSFIGSNQAAGFQLANLDADEVFPTPPALQQYNDPCKFSSWQFEDCGRCLERSDISTMFLARQLTPWFPEPSLEVPSSFKDRLKEELGKVSADEVWQGMFQDYQLDILEGAFCASREGEVYARLIRKLVTSTAELHGDRLWRWTWELMEHSLLLEEAQLDFVFQIWEALTQKSDPDRNERNSEMFLVPLILPRLNAGEQLVRLLQRSEETADLLQHKVSFRPLTDLAEIDRRIEEAEAASALSLKRVLWFLSANAEALPSEAIERVAGHLTHENQAVRLCVLQILYDSHHSSAVRALDDCEWTASASPLSNEVENHWGSLLLARNGQHLSFEGLKVRIDPAYLGLAVEQRGATDGDVQEYAEFLHGVWEIVMGLDPEAVESLPEVEITAPRNPMEPVLCRYRVVEEVDSSVKFINPYAYWGRVPDSVDLFRQLEMVYSPEEEEKARERSSQRERLQGEETGRQRRRGNLWFRRVFYANALPQVIKQRPDLVKQWLDPSPGCLLLASTFYEALCGALLEELPREGIDLYWKLRNSKSPVRIVAEGGIERLDFFLFKAPAIPEVLEAWELRLDQCHTDQALLELVIVAEHGNGGLWLHDVCKRDLVSDMIWKQARALMLLGLSEIGTVSQTLEQYADHGQPEQTVSWLASVARKAIEHRRHHEWAQYWYRRFFAAADNVQAWSAIRLLLRCADRRFWSWQSRFGQPHLSGSAERRWIFFRNNLDTLKNHIRSNERPLADAFLGSKVLPGEVGPWLELERGE